jgi:EAL domain-containing protein (putative c-di-GMP-specific phosphodiesterase class I)
MPQQETRSGLADVRSRSRTRRMMHQPDGANRDESGNERWLHRGLTAAVANGGFVLHYQPRISLADGRQVGAEALIRWPHRKRGYISPSTFIPVAERTGHIIRIGGWVLETACKEAARWDEGCVSVNVSARQLADHALVGHVAHALECSGLEPELLELELTESMLLEVSRETLLTLSAIRDLGVGLALDDFGTGFASLAMLRRLPLTAMKLDRSLVRELPGSFEDAAIVRAIVQTGHALGLTVVGEGIETESQRSFLASTGCEEGQGALFSPAVPADMLRNLSLAA